MDKIIMINEETVKRVGEIARLELTASEISTFAEQLNDVVENFKILDEVNVEGVEPSFHPIKTENVFREDKAEKCLNRKKVLDTAVHTEDGYIKAPKIV